MIQQREIKAQDLGQVARSLFEKDPRIMGVTGSFLSTKRRSFLRGFRRGGIVFSGVMVTVMTFSELSTSKSTGRLAPMTARLDMDWVLPSSRRISVTPATCTSFDRGSDSASSPRTSRTILGGSRSLKAVKGRRLRAEEFHHHPVCRGVYLDRLYYRGLGLFSGGLVLRERGAPAHNQTRYRTRMQERTIPFSAGSASSPWILSLKMNYKAPIRHFQLLEGTFT
jgi:hypothetical protein